MDRDLSANFIGTFEHKLDGKGRISLPSDYRDALRAQNSANEIVVIPTSAAKPCLQVLSREGHNRLVRSLNDTHFESEEQEDATRHFYISLARPITVEETGRFVLPKELREDLGFPGDKGGDVVFRSDAGCFEIWAKADYDTQYPSTRTAPKTIRLGRF